MANIYVRSTTGADANSGATWALAKATLAGAALIDAAGDTVFVSQAHAEVDAANQACNWAGTETNPTKIICGNDGAEPPTAVATSGSFSTTTVAILQNTSGAAYFYGIKFNMGSGANNTSIEWNNRQNIECELCQFVIVATGGTSFIQLGPPAGGASGTKIWTNCDVKFANAGSKIKVNATNFHWRGGSVLAGSTAVTTLFSAFLSTFPANVLIEDVDFSNLGTAANFFTPNEACHIATIRNCKLPASWSGSLVSAAMNFVGSRASMYNCDSGSTTYKVNIADYAGTIKDEIVDVRTGGASNGITPMSWKMVTNATPTVGIKYSSLISDELVMWNDTTGSSKTITVEFLHDSATNLKNNEIWIEVEYLGASGSPLGTHVNDWIADPLATAADQATSTATWTTTGLANPNKQKLQITFTPQTKGYIHAKVYLNKPSYTVFVDNTMTLT